MKERWKDIEDYEGLYQISNIGRVKSLKCNRKKIYTVFEITHHYKELQMGSEFQKTLIVDVNGNGDYSDINSAASALSSSGGAIIVEEGEYELQCITHWTPLLEPPKSGLEPTQ